MRINTKLTKEQMVVEVNDYIKRLELCDGILGFETDEDKVLYYRNYLDPQNKFRGILELNSYYFIKLTNLICNTPERIKLFQEKFYNADGNIAQQIRQFRRYILDNRENSDEFLGVMDKMIKYQLYDELQGVICELFLEPIEQHIFDRIRDMIHIDGLDAEDIYYWYSSKRNVKAIVTQSVEYIKSLH